MSAAYDRHKAQVQSADYDGTEYWHGTRNGYSNRMCRCDRCRAAHAEGVQRDKANRANRTIPEHVHGTENGYGNYSCRCDRCTAAWSGASVERAKRRKARKAA